MDKNTITGFVLIAATVIGFSYFSRPSEEDIKQQQLRQAEYDARMDSINAENEKREFACKQAIAEAVSDSSSLFHAQRGGEGKEVVLENDLVRLTFNTKGAVLESAELKTYKKAKKDNVMLLRKDANKMQYILNTREQLPLRSRDFVFHDVQTDSLSVTMTLSDARGEFTVKYALQPDGYMLTTEIGTNSKQTFTNGSELAIVWCDTIAQQEKGYDFENRYSNITYRYTDGDVDNLSETSADLTDLTGSTLDWVAFKNQFFSSVIIADKQFTDVQLVSQLQPNGSGNLKHYAARMNAKFDASGKTATKLYMYLGPNDFHVLQDASKQISSKDVELEGMIYFGWPIIRWINRWFILYLFDWLTAWGLPMGIVLLLLTIIVKMLVYPATKKSYVSSAKMRVLKPKVDELNRKYPNREDAMRKQQEMMQLYSQYGVSPMGGCLPMLIQMPIWIALFNFVPNAIELRGESFLWADDLSSYDDLLSWGTSIPLLGDHLSIFCLLFCATNIINTMISMRQQQNQLTGDQAQQMKVMRWMMYLMPVMFFFMFNNYSSGLCYYYFLSGLTSILIMWFLRKRTDDKKLLARLEAYREQHKNDPKKMSGMVARMEAMRKLQEEQQRRHQR